ncbi:hypothetical protein Gbth_058_013 [Gluconobacter thailandicus F149-1 = NBRC 100600]|uniref:Helix-turn-helix domain-containing protein n=1 Tax=Gluconobacter thailandicus NBRC 3257 TaxID=1381097 RepID=A0ABQ0ITQ7_GLUTH|nr:hypothetical protein [Gluconobacter thailandicus]KXV54037.1 hypothetical protein AD946_04860 [Gluconobacter thailandicus]GAC88852.1 hypothetical protein NBRC3255_2513 [Gluconobacter thailandicus NBRC 3255]GAD25601.1 hypothetical protein NBRC3257_0600 [Gluconobacter thailandicus NBRC 3257]GAN94356.1 hypothetical protein Gbth_058_013 [Gluconobacter thailandicus F149-1 = NBRC 100600]GBR61712.1 hypothetical protein AA100600_3043 [Gluconobacter thailandicus F149-1 = NBRC 100600]
MTPPSHISGHNTTGQVFHLPLRSRLLATPEAAVYLGLSLRRLKTLSILGAGPQRTHTPDGRPAYRREDLETYLSTLYEKADISDTERVRRRAERANQRNATLERLQAAPQIDLPLPDPFMMMATTGEMCQHMVFFALKVMAIFGFILLCISPTPLLRTHFN